MPPINFGERYSVTVVYSFDVVVVQSILYLSLVVHLMLCVCTCRSSCIVSNSI